jgi:transcriptional regulator with XRE-family HTH domain
MRPARKIDPKHPHADVGRRLAWLRKTMRHKQAEMASAIGCSPSQWNHWESGLRPIPMDEAIKLCEWADVSLDWIYRGVDVR